MWCGYYDGNEKSKKRGNIKVDKIFSKCGMRCDLCLIYRPNVQENDRRKEICIVYSKIYPGYEFGKNRMSVS